MHKRLEFILSNVQMCFLPANAAGSSWRPHQTVRIGDDQGSSPDTRRVAAEVGRSIVEDNIRL